MAQPYVGEVRIFAGNFAPAGWMFCDGQELPISENETLFMLIGTTYGGDGEVTFRLPDLRGRLPVHMGNGVSRTYPLAEAAGVEQVTLTVQQMPAHAHPLLVSADNATQSSAAGAVLAQTPSHTPYVDDAPRVPLAPASVGPVGGSQPHTNLQPSLCLSFIISLFGIFPSQT